MAFVALWDQGLNPCLLHQKADSFTVEPPGKPTLSLKKKLFVYFWLLWVLVAVHRLSLDAALGFLIVVAALVAEYVL